jgi:diaminobutyrate-2-oxoglutarate transaminase
VTARVALEKFWSDDVFARKIMMRANLVTERLTRIAEGIPGSRLKGRGMMQGLDVGSGELASDICSRCFERGLIIETSGAYDEVVKILAPLTTPDVLLERGLDILESVAKAAVSTNRVAAE